MLIAKRFLFFMLLIGFQGCSTMNESLELGATMGFASGALATYGAHSSIGSKASLENVATNAGIGLGIGLLAAYLTHNSVQEERERDSADQVDLHFGDLPPSPFVIPKVSKKGGKR